MGCTNCGSGNALPKGCKNNGTCGVSGCGKMPVFDWLSNMNLPKDQHICNIAEVRFKNGRKEYFHNKPNLSLQMGDTVVVEGNPGHDVGVVSLRGELVRFQMRKRGIKENSEQVRNIYRIATQKDIDIWQKSRKREQQLMMDTRSLAKRLNLDMKISDVEVQGDGTKAIFYYTAEGRVDFRLLIKEMAATFRLRVEMKQIGLRQEAARIGGIGSCGRELCCATWLTDFRSVSTSAARYQQLSLNPQKLAGQCGKLKCCLNYELDSYIEAVKKFPDTSKKLSTKAGDAYFQKMDIFKGLMWYTMGKESPTWLTLDYREASRIIDMNAKGEKPDGLEAFAIAPEIPEEHLSITNVVGQDDLSRFDRKKGNQRKRSSKRKKTNRTLNRDKK
jgi:cell fate regulator YaaT (PSP1 superfamily)